jgi:hypothetical protein
VEMKLEQKESSDSAEEEVKSDKNSLFGERPEDQELSDVDMSKPMRRIKQEGDVDE